MVIGLQIVVQWKIRDLQVYGDSQLIINQVNDDYETKDENLTPYKQLAEELKQHFANITFEQILRVQK